MLVRADWQYAIGWQFQVRPAFRIEFEQAYNRQGVWGQLFRLSKGYIGTELIRDENNPHRYVTIDLWRSRQDYEDFHRQHADQYRQTDQRCERMTETEQALGTFERVSPLS